MPEGVLDGLNVAKCILVGSSWGSPVAVAFAAHYSDRLIAAVVTNGTATPPSPEVTAQMTELVGNLERFTAAPDWLLPATQSAFAGPTAEAGKPGFMSYLGHVLREDSLSIANAMRGILLGREDLHPVARMIEGVPTLILAGEEERFFTMSEGESIAHAVEGTLFVTMHQRSSTIDWSSHDDVDCSGSTRTQNCWIGPNHWQGAWTERIQLRSHPHRSDNV